MSTATLSFDLPEENNDLAMAIDAKEAFWALCKINDFVRKAIESDEEWTKDPEARRCLKCILDNVAETRATDLIE